VYESVVKLLRRGLGEVGTQLVRRGGVVETVLPGDVHVAAHISTNKQSRGEVGMNLPLGRDGWNARQGGRRRGLCCRDVLLPRERMVGWRRRTREKGRCQGSLAGVATCCSLRHLIGWGRRINA
jgi:hypothetical protein